MILPNFGVTKLLPCVRDKASKNYFKKKIGKNEKSNHDNVLIASTVQ